jgi:erythromycin esterase-like protein
MQKLEQQNTTRSDCRSGWTDEEKRIIAAVAFPYLEMQESFGHKRDPKLLMQGWERKFAGRYSVEQLVFAMDTHTDQHTTFPTPAHINQILNPKAPKVTQAEYIAAQEWQKRNNSFDKFTDQYETIKAFEKQGAEEKEQFKIQNKQLQNLAQNSLKRIS